MGVTAQLNQGGSTNHRERVSSVGFRAPTNLCLCPDIIFFCNLTEPLHKDRNPQTYQGRQCFALSTHVAAFNAFRHSQLLKLLSVIRALILRDVGTPICHRCSHTQNQIVRTGESVPPRQFLDITEVPKSGSNSFRISKSLNMTCS